MRLYLSRDKEEGDNRGDSKQAGEQIERQLIAAGSVVYVADQWHPRDGHGEHAQPK